MSMFFCVKLNYFILLLIFLIQVLSTTPVFIRFYIVRRMGTHYICSAGVLHLCHNHLHIICFSIKSFVKKCRIINQLPTKCKNCRSFDHCNLCSAFSVSNTYRSGKLGSSICFFNSPFKYRRPTINML